MRSMTDLYWLRVREIALEQQRAEAEHEERAELTRVIAPFRPDAERTAA